MAKLAVCAVIPCGHLYMAVSRKDNPNDFGLPGGKVDDFESLHTALVREVREETGYVVHVRQDLPSYARMDGDYLVYTYLCTLADFEWKQPAKEETGVVRLVTKQQLTEGCSFAEYNTGMFEWLSRIYEEEVIF